MKKISLAALAAGIAMVLWFWWSRPVESGHDSAPSAPLANETPQIRQTNNASSAKVQSPSPSTQLPDQTSPTTPSLSYGQTLYENVSEPDPQGKWTRVRVVEAEFKYPHLRVEETYERNAITGDDRLLDKKEMAADHIIVRLRPDVPESALRALNEKHGARILRKLALPNTYLVQFANYDLGTIPQVIKDYSADSANIAYAEPDYVAYANQIIPNDPSFGELYGLHNTGQSGGTADADIDAPEAWVVSTGSPDVVVGIIDTGVDYNHEDLSSNVWVNPGEIPGDQIDNDNNGYVDDVHGWDFINDDADPIDDNSHGTHVAGTIAAMGNNGIGVVGVNWRSRVMALKFLGASGSGPTSDAADALMYAAMMKKNHGINIRLTSNSWGGSGTLQSLIDAIEINKSNDVLFVAAAGNDGVNNDTSPHYPSSYSNDNVISVAATDRNDLKAGFSNYGALSVDLGAPGVATYSTTPGNTYGIKSGTSMATPHVSGVVALMLSVVPDASWLDIKEALLAGVDLIPSMASKTLTGGRLNAAGAIQSLGMRVRSTIPANGDIVTTPPTNVIVKFNHALDANSVETTDCILNGITANTFNIEDGVTVKFSFNASPITNEGLQTIDIPEGAVARLDAPQSNRAYQAHFRYDTVQMAVIATEPANGSVVNFPFTNIVLYVNEPVDPSSVGTNDLAISQGSVIGAQLLNSTSVVYTLTGVAKEGVLTVKLLKGALVDVYQNPCLTYDFTLNLDFSTFAFPLPFTRLSPPGALIYEGKIDAFITAVDSDEYTLDLAEGHTLSALLEPVPGLRATVTLVDPDGQTIASNTVSEAGARSLIQAQLIPSNGTYKIRVAGLSGTTGGYTLNALLNTVLEEEEYASGSNNSPAHAQSIDAGFIQLGNATRTRTAVFGSIRSTGTQPIFAESFESGSLGSNWTTYSSTPEGRIQVSDAVTAGDGVRSLLMDRSSNGSNNLNEAIWHVNLAGLNQVELRFKHAQWNDEIQIWLNDRRTGHFSSDSISISDKGGAWQQVFRPTAQTTGTWIQRTVDLTEPARQGRMRFGHDFQIKFQQYDNDARPNDGMGFDALEILGPVPAEDWYRCQLEAGDHVNIRLAPQGGALLDVELYDASNTLIKVGEKLSDSTDETIEVIQIPRAGTYYLRVMGAGEIDYTLLVLRNASFDAEPNDIDATARDITGTGLVLGELSSAASLYAYEAPSGELGSILRLDPRTLAVQDGFSAPYYPGTVYGAFVGELSFDGTYLWFTGGETTGGVNRIFKIDKDTGDAIAYFDVAPTSVVTGVGNLNGELFLGTQQHTIDVYDDSTFALKRNLPDNVIGWLTGLEGSTARNVMFMTAKGDTLFALNPLTGSIVQQVSMNPRPDGVELALGLAAGEAFISNYGGDVDMLVLRTDTMQLVRELKWDGSPLAGLGGVDTGGPKDIYRVNATSGDTLTIRTFTPGSALPASKTMANPLDPIITLIDPDGIPVATNDNSVGDGLNALITHPATKTGAYRIRVASTNSSIGEYMLTVSGSTTGSTNSSIVTVTSPSNVTVECGDDMSATALGTASATSSCGSYVVMSYADSAESGSCGGAHVVVRTWTAMDACGGVASNTQLITVIDTTPPSLTPPNDAYVSWGGDLSPTFAGTASVTDSCSEASISGYADSITNGLAPNEIRIIREWAAVDDCGNSISLPQTITITNVIPPVMEPEPGYTMGDANTVTWNGPGLADLFSAQYSSNSDFEDAQTISWTTEQELSVTGLLEDTVYYYRAKAALTNVAGLLETEWSEGVSSIQLSPDGDWDLDGLNNRDETVAGTSPLDPESNVELLGLTEKDGAVEIEWKGGTNVLQILEFTPILSPESWKDAYTNPPQTDPTNKLLLLPQGDAGIFRLRSGN